MKIVKAHTFLPETNAVFLLSEPSRLESLPFTPEEVNYMKNAFQTEGRKSFMINKLGYYVFIQFCENDSGYDKMEFLRKRGDKAATYFTRVKQKQITLFGGGIDVSAVMAFAEGFALGCYQFVAYKTGEQKPAPEYLGVYCPEFSESQVVRLQKIVDACYITRNLVNEPPVVMDAQYFAGAMAKLGSKVGLDVQVLDREKIEELNFRGLLTVNRGSSQAPAFTIIEWKPEDAVLQNPIILIGKGLVFDTGGINLKPGSGLDTMKSDMAGGAAVFGTLYALALNKVPVYVIGLIPATDNRPGGNAMVPGDIIRMANGKTVEIVNTDAEGRLVLADALHYATRYRPRLVIDIATLTGAASMALGRFAIAGMHQDAHVFMKHLTESSMKVYERIVEFPLWDEYGKEIESDVADIRNLGRNKGGGAITAGKFLAHFIQYPWIHLDIAPMAFMESRESYLGKGATGVGVRLLYDFIEREACQ